MAMDAQMERALQLRRGMQVQYFLAACGSQLCLLSMPSHEARRNSATGTRTRVARARAEYPNQLDYSGFWWELHFKVILA